MLLMPGEEGAHNKIEQALKIEIEYGFWKLPNK